MQTYTAFKEIYETTVSNLSESTLFHDLLSKIYLPIFFVLTISLGLLLLILIVSSMSRNKKLQGIYQFLNKHKLLDKVIIFGTIFLVIGFLLSVGNQITIILKNPTPAELEFSSTVKSRSLLEEFNVNEITLDTDDNIFVDVEGLGYLKFDHNNDSVEVIQTTDNNNSLLICYEFFTQSSAEGYSTEAYRSVELYTSPYKVNYTLFVTEDFYETYIKI